MSREEKEAIVPLKRDKRGQVTININAGRSLGKTAEAIRQAGENIRKAFARGFERDMMQGKPDPAVKGGFLIPEHARQALIDHWPTPDRVVNARCLPVFEDKPCGFPQEIEGELPKLPEIGLAVEDNAPGEIVEVEEDFDRAMSRRVRINGNVKTHEVKSRLGGPSRWHVQKVEVRPERGGFFDDIE